MGWRFKPGNHAQQCGFAAARGAEQGKKFFVENVEMDIIERFMPSHPRAEDFIDAPNFYANMRFASSHPLFPHKYLSQYIYIARTFCSAANVLVKF
jgi:hypothetical protein